MKLFCVVGVHDWSEWVHAASRCVDERVCRSCKKYESLKRHRFNKWEQTVQEINSWVDGEVKITGRYSIQIRYCADCNLKESIRCTAP